jgi:hypothetical protein
MCQCQQIALGQVGVRRHDGTLSAGTNSPFPKEGDQFGDGSFTELGQLHPCPFQRHALTIDGVAGVTTLPQKHRLTSQGG